MADIGLVGLGVMGANLALNMAEKGYTRRGLQPHHRQDRRLHRRCRQPRAAADRLPDARRTRRRDRAAAADHHHGPGRRRRSTRQAEALAAELANGDMLIDAGNANFRDTRRRVGDLHASAASISSASASPAARRARATAPRSWPAARRGAWARVETILVDISAKFDGEPCARAGRAGGRRPLRQDHPQRHRICRHADDRRDLRHHARRPRLRAGRDGRRLRRWNEGPLKSYLIEITAKVLAADRPEDRQAAGRGHPRHRRPEGHRPLVGDGGAGPRRAGDGHRGGGRRPRPVGAARPAPRRRERCSARRR